jgi:hypothetical protein
MKHVLKAEIDFEKLQEELGPYTPLREHVDRYVSLASCEKAWAPRFVFCDRDCFVNDLLECIEEVGIEKVIAISLSGSSYFSDWMRKNGKA